jgi:hypothetical protein
VLQKKIKADFIAEGSRFTVNEVEIKKLMR